MPPGLFAEAARLLALTGPEDKCEAVAAFEAAVARGAFAWDPETPVPPVDRPGRPSRPELVDPARVPRRRLGTEAGRIALAHAVAHIEFNAINLALDALARFRRMPADYYTDWLSVAADEARHFQLMASRLQELGSFYGALPAHDGLWDMARDTADACLVRMALVPRVLEARGLDVTPGMIDRLRTTGDDATADALEVILREEVRHVAIGSRWFRWCCAQQGLEPDATFRDLLVSRYRGIVRGPLNLSARTAAGFSGAELDWLARTG